MSAVHFPKGFALGAASAATQIDGDCKESNWYEWYQNGKIKDNSDPNIATDHRGHLEEDTRLMAEMGIRHYRFGLEWARLEPQEGQFSQEEIEKVREEITLLHRLHEDVLAKYDAFTVGETVFVTPKMADDLVNPARGELSTVFAFEHMETDCYKIKWFLRRFSPDRFFACLTKWQKALPWNTVYLENHDQPRSVSRFGNDTQYHDESAKALATLVLTLRGTPFLYEGQEIGMTNFDFSGMEKVQDVESINIWNMGKQLHLPYSLRWRMIKTKSRDNARTPMQWNDSPNAGFTTGTPWLSVNGNYPRINAARQENAPNSVLAYYRQLIAFRNGSEILQAGDFSELYCKDGVYAYRRSLNVESLIVVISLSTKERPNPVSGTVVLSNYGRQESPACLSPYEALILREV